MTRQRSTIPHLFDEWASVSKLIRASHRLAMFIDFDGTLVGIAAKPELVRLTDRTRGILEKLATRPEVALAVISGRRRVELQSYLGITGITYFGVYGWEGNGNAKLSPPVRRALRYAHANIAAEIAAYPGVWIEPKQNCFSIHLLAVSGETQRHIRRSVKFLVKPMSETLRVISNLRDIEVAPACVEGKGATVRKLLGEPAFRGRLPIYFGDDLSDEPAFTAVRKGISILVGKQRVTRARYYLRGPDEVATTLSRIESILS